jgi:hypothetical protein
MPGPKRSRRERTDEWASIKQWTLWPEQTLYEEIRPIILFGQTPGERAKEIDAAQRTLSRKADEFEKYGMQNLFATQEPRNQTETSRSLPEAIRQLIVDLHCEMPAMSWREIADICFDHAVLQRTHLAGDPLSPSDLVAEIQCGAPLRPSGAPRRATRPGSGVTWNVGAQQLVLPEFGATG